MTKNSIGEFVSDREVSKIKKQFKDLEAYNAKKTEKYISFITKNNLFEFNINQIEKIQRLVLNLHDQILKYPDYNSVPNNLKKYYVKSLEIGQTRFKIYDYHLYEPEDYNVDIKENWPSPKASEVDKLLNKAIDICKNGLKNANNDDEKLWAILKFHITMEFIHPFMNGNTRAGRYVVDCLLIDNGFKPFSSTFDGEERDFYNHIFFWFKDDESFVNKSDPFLIYLPNHDKKTKKAFDWFKKKVLRIPQPLAKVGNYSIK